MYIKFVAKKVAIALITLWVVMTLNFFIFRVLYGGDPTQTIIDPRFKDETRQALLQMWGLNQPLHIQYLIYLYNLLTWRYGNSFDASATPIAPEMLWRLRNTVILLGTATAGTISIGIPLGILAGARRGRKLDVTVIGIGLLTWGVPAFFIQLIWAAVFCVYLGWLPRAGIVSLPPPSDPYEFAIDVLKHAISPIITLILAGFGSWAFYTRNLMVDALTEDYILTAKAKGLHERDILIKHAFRSILPPIVTMIALSIPGIVTGAIITESVFAWPGIGQWYIQALSQMNHPVTQAVLYNYAVLMIAANLVTDLAYGFLDPRIRVGVRR